MQTPTKTVVTHPLNFIRHAAISFWKNQGFLLAGALAYNALLSFVPLVLVSLLLWSKIRGTPASSESLVPFLDLVVPGQSGILADDISHFFEQAPSLGLVMGATLIFFGSMAFSVLQKAMSAIFSHRKAVSERHTLMFFALPFLCVLGLAAGLLIFGLAASSIQTIANKDIYFLGRIWSLDLFSTVAMHVIGYLGISLFLAAIYWIMPIGKTSFGLALFGGIVAASVWEAIRQGLILYFSITQTSGTVYGSMATAVLLLFSLEVAAILMLFGAQVMAEYEIISRKLDTTAP